MSSNISQRVAKQVCSEYAPEDREEILQALSMYGREDGEPEVELVHMAILTLAQGNVEELYDYLLYAKQDPAGALAWAQEKREKGLI